jgi:hypothetical protein
MRRRLAWCVSILFAAVAATASALPGTFLIEQIYSNAGGTVQFVVILDTGRTDCDAGEALWAGQTLRSTGPGMQQTFVFPTNLPSCKTSGRRMLVATQGFVALGLIPPDFVIPNGFLQRPSGGVEFAGVSQVSYTALPNDGVTAIDATGKAIQNVATNFAGASVSVVPATTAAIAPVVEYYNAALDHYFITWLPAEIEILDVGVTIKGWTRTGRAFNVYKSQQPDSSEVCRFYIPPLLGNSHFFGRGTAECNETQTKFPAFTLEDPRFMHIVLPSAGVCPTATAPIYRVFSNRSDANHRYMPDRATRDHMVAIGWLAEGDGPDLVVMCAPS